MSEAPGPDWRPYWIVFSERLSLNLFRFEGSDWPMLALTIAVVLTAGRLGNSLIAFAALLVMLGLMFRWMDGRTYYLAYRRMNDFYIRKFKKGVIAQPKFRKDGTLGRAWRQAVIHLQPFPLGDGHDVDVGVLTNTSRKLHTLFLVSDGSPFASRNPAEQYADIDLMNQGVVRAQATYDKPVGFSTLFSVRPPNSLEVIGDFADHAWPGTWSPIITVPEAELDGEDAADLWTHHNMLGVINMVSQTTSQVTEAFAVTMPEEGSLKDAIEKGTPLTTDDLMNLPLVKAAKTYLNAIMATGALDIHLATFGELLGILRGGWDVSDVDEFYELIKIILKQMLPDDGMEDFDEDQTGVADEIDVDRLTQLIWPTDITVGKDWIKTDTTYHTVFRLTGSNELNMPDFEQQLHRSCNTNALREGIPYYTISQVGESRGSTSAYAMTGWLISVLDAFRDLYGFSRTGPRAQKRTASLEAKQEVQDENRIIMHYGRLVQVAARSLVELNRDASIIMTTCDTLGYGPRRVTGESWQLEKLLEATTCNNN